MRTLEIKVNQSRYNVYLGINALDKLTDYINPDNKVLVITDQTVYNLHYATLSNALTNYDITVFKLGDYPEMDKNLAVYEEVLDLAISKAFDRSISVLAFGGGAVGDFAGYFASTYKRGVTFYQIPTTILAHDSSVGGKVALNHQDVKNVVGAFYQPKAVFYNPEFIKTLPLEEVRSGFAEIIKHDLLSDGQLLKKINTIDNIINNETLLIDHLYQAIETKYRYIEDDPYDTLGKRSALNLGHTLGHSLEVLYDYTHGEAILFGICFDLFLTNPTFALACYHQFKSLGYFAKRTHFNLDDMIKKMKNDKKNEGSSLKFIGLQKVGDPYEVSLTTDQFKVQFTAFLELIKW